MMVSFGSNPTPTATTAADPDVPRWYACYTRARHEKKVEQLLGQRGIDSYLPTVTRVQQWKDRRRPVSFVMFPSYVFARCAPNDLSRITALPGVAGIVRQNGQPAPIAADELENVRRFADVAGTLEDAPQVKPLPAEGSPVHITEGPFRGIDAVVVAHRGRARVLVCLNAIGQGLEVDVDASVLQHALS
jgi:transcriptional antiterminator RfaH